MNKAGNNGLLYVFKGFNMSQDLLQGREVIIEFHPVGHVVKVSAMDTQTLTEVSIQGPASSPQEILKRNALKRLEYVLKKKGHIS